MPMLARPGAAPDCAITSMNMSVQARRLAAIVDVGVKVHGVKGGTCLLQPDAVQVTTGRSSGVSRPVSMLISDGQVSRPIAVAEAANGERLRPWVMPFKPGEEHEVVFRFYVEGDMQPNGDVDPPSRVVVDLRTLGARIYNGAPLAAKVTLEPGFKGRVTLNTGNPKLAGSPRPTQDNSLSLSAALTKEDLRPQLDWRYEGDVPPAATADHLSGGLAPFEYLRDGLVRDLAASFGDPTDKKDDKKKDEKKDDKKDKAPSPQEAAWDQAYDVSLVAARSSDPLLAGLGLRSLAWLASGLNVASTSLKGPEDSSGDAAAALVPSRVLSEVSKAAGAFQGATGQRNAPSTVSARSLKGVLPRLGEPGAHKKEAEEALKRLDARLADSKVTLAVGNVFSMTPSLPLPPGVNPRTARLLQWSPRGPIFSPTGDAGSGPKSPAVHRMVHGMTHLWGLDGPSSPKSPLVHRMVHGMSHLGGLVRWLVTITILGGIIVAAWWLYGNKQREQLGAAGPAQA
jgi:hypothetical protein